MRFYVDARDAGRTLARGLRPYVRRGASVYPLTRSAVPIAKAVAETLGLALELRTGPSADIVGRDAILVDDGTAGAAASHAAIRAARAGHARRVIVAMPVAAATAVAELEERADEVVCPLQPARVGSVRDWYDRFHDADAGALATLDHARAA